MTDSELFYILEIHTCDHQGSNDKMSFAIYELQKRMKSLREIEKKYNDIARHYMQPIDY